MISQQRGHSGDVPELCRRSATCGVGSVRGILSLSGNDRCLHGIKVGLLLELTDVLLVANSLVAEPVADLARRKTQDTGFEQKNWKMKKKKSSYKLMLFQVGRVDLPEKRLFRTAWQVPLWLLRSGMGWTGGNRNTHSGPLWPVCWSCAFCVCGNKFKERNNLVMPSWISRIKMQRRLWPSYKEKFLNKISGKKNLTLLL